VAAERPLRILCEGESLYGILHLADKAATRGVVIVVGGPQYRAGSHRQFVLLARHLALAGVPVLRFDYRGMGDSEGEARNFENIDADIRAAIDAFLREVAGLREVVLWGLCDAASAALFYAPRDRRVRGLALLNPWVRTEAGAAGAYLKRYYLARILDRGFWRKLIRGEFDVGASLRSLRELLRARFGRGAQRVDGQSEDTRAPQSRGASCALPLPDRMLAALRQYNGRVLVILSGNDLTAEEFRSVVSASRDWRRRLRNRNVTQRHLREADHTFSRDEWRRQVAVWTAGWVKSW
jgi:exosortase A-associated hydrolase 1